VNPEVAHALELARRRYGPNLEGALPREVVMQNAIRVRKGLHKAHPKTAFSAGVEAKHKGWGRTSPYYEATGSDHFWFAGYDGKTMEEAIETQ
jgi:hypothetical protein